METVDWIPDKKDAKDKTKQKKIVEQVEFNVVAGVGLCFYYKDVQNSFDMLMDPNRTLG